MRWLNGYQVPAYRTDTSFEARRVLDVILDAMDAPDRKLRNQS